MVVSGNYYRQPFFQPPCRFTSHFTGGHDSNSPLPLRPLMPPFPPTLPISQPTLQRPDAYSAAIPSRPSHRVLYFPGRVSNLIEDRYIPFSLRDLWKSLDGYLARNWTDLRLTLEDIYESTSAQSRHLEKKLFNLVRHSLKSCMSDEEDVLCCCWQFLTLSMPLQNAQRLSIGQRSKLF